MPNADLSIIEDAKRLTILRGLCLLDTPTEPAFDRLTRLAARILKVPISLVTLVDSDRQFFKSQFGLTEPLATERQNPMSYSFCQHAVATKSPFIVEDAHEHPLVADNPAVEELDVVSYLGIPLITSDGSAIGTFCVIDHQPRQWTDDDIAILKDLTASVMTEIELRAEVAAREDVERTLRKREYFINQVMRNIPAILYIYDVARREIIYINRTLNTILCDPIESGDPVELLFTKSLVHHQDLQAIQAQMDKSQTDENNDSVSVDYRYKLRDEPTEAEWRWANVVNQPFLYDEHGTAIQMLGIIRDVTAIKRQVDQEIKIMLEKEQIRVMGDFIRNTSHDLRTPLTMIQTNLDLIRRTNDPNRMEERLDKMTVRVQQMSNVLDDFVTMAELYKHTSVKGEYIDINRVVGEAVAVLLKRYRISSYIRESFGAELPSVYGDADQLRQAIYALLENAVVHSDMSDTALEIGTSLHNDQVMIEVRDYGHGIKSEALKHVFELFYKGNIARTLDGSGLGLAMVKKIITLHNGSIEARSEEGEGTLMTIILPAAIMPVMS